MKITVSQKRQLLNEMNSQFSDKKRIKQGIDQLLALWDKKKDGDFKKLKTFCLTYFIDEVEALEEFRNKLELIFEKTGGHLLEIHSVVNYWKDLELAPLTPHDELFSNYNPFRHLSDDLFELKWPFAILLNFKQWAFKTIVKEGKDWEQDQWLEVKLTEGYHSRVPANISNKTFIAHNKASSYINQYNIFLDAVLNHDGNKLYTEEKRLISHWGLRDELKGLYSEENGKEKQELIFKVMQHIIKGTIPKEMINSKKYLWNPFSNKLYDQNLKEVKLLPEGNHRYTYWHNIFKANLQVDKFYLSDKSLIDRRFNISRKIPEKRVEKIFTDLLTSKAMPMVAQILRQKLGRELRPYDIWYPELVSERKGSQLDQAVQKYTPTVEAFNKKIPEILQKLGFSKEKSKDLADLIVAQPSRSAGHARGAAMRGEKALLRVRTDQGKFNYQAFNTAMHELGHTVEQTISMNWIDHTLLEGVPNTAFTEAIAFLFQDLDKKILGVEDQSNSHVLIEEYKTLDAFLSTCEIASMALVDMYAWRYMYRRKKCQTSELKSYVIRTARTIWKKYWAPHFGENDESLLAIYSHMIDAGLYLPDYPLGHIICYQIEQYLKNNDLASNIERMCKLGAIYPDIWMEKAVGAPISPELLINDAIKAATKIQEA